MGKTYQSIVIDAPIDKVWSAIRNFHDFSWAPNVITKCEAVGNLEGSKIGAKRRLNDAFEETLLKLSDTEYTIQYSVDDGPSPVSKNEISNYIGSVRLLPITDTDNTFMEWSSSWKGNGNQVEGFCHNIYVALLSDLKKSIL